MDTPLLIPQQPSDRSVSIRAKQSQSRNKNTNKNKRRKQNSSVHGHVYQIKLLMLFFYRGVSHEYYSFRLGTEIEECKKFDDVLWECTKDGRKEYSLLQAKHKFGKCKKITADLLTESGDDDYSLTKYFFSYQDLKKEKFFNGSSIKDVTIYTNIDLDFEDLERAKIGVEKIEGKDDILDVKSDKKPMRYRLNEDVTSALKPKFQDYNLNKLARRLAEYFLKNKYIGHCDTSNIFISYHLVLAEEVIDTKYKKFHDKFIEDRDISKITKKFRKAFIEEIRRQSPKRLTLENINEAIDNKEVGLNLSINFGKGEDKNWPNNTISDDEIKDFLNHFVLAVNQPDEDELGEIIKGEIGKGFNLDCNETENIYNKLFKYILNWYQGKRGDRFLSYEDGKKFFDEARRGIPIWFDVDEPVALFNGRVKVLKKLHNALQSEGEAASISGLAGIGKTELATKYAYDHVEDYDEKVIWINAENYQTLGESFLRLAKEKLGINVEGTDGKPKHIKSIVEDVYRYFSKGKSLFIFDNAEKRRTQDDGDEGIDKFLPSLPSNAKKPHILITSQYQNWGNIKVIQLDKFTKKEATDFIRRALACNMEDDSQKHDIQKLMEILDQFPLALTQAVTYIKQEDRAIKIVTPSLEFKIEDYLKEYEEKTKTLLDFKFPHDSNNKYRRTTFTTFQLTFDKIKRKENGHKALEILDIMAYCAPDNIPTKIFIKLFKKGDDIRKLGATVILLKDYSIVNEKTGILSVHRLVQEVTRINLVVEKREEDTLRKALELIKSCDADNKGESPSQCINYPTTEAGQLLSNSEQHATYIWSYASKYGQLIKDFYFAYGEKANTPIHLLAIKGEKKAIESILNNIEKDRLIDKVNEYNGFGYAPIHLAALYGQTEIVKYLIEEHGVNICFVTRGSELPPTTVAVLGKQFDVVKYLVGKKGANPNKGGKYDQFPIHIAANNAWMDLIKFLVNNKADVLLKDYCGMNVLHMALLHLTKCQNHLSDIEEILKYFLEINSVLVNDANRSAMSPLHVAAQFPFPSIVTTLLGYGANVNAKSYPAAGLNPQSIHGHDKGYTALHIAVENGHEDVAQVLLKNGAIYNDVNMEGKTPLQVAKHGSKVGTLLNIIDKLFQAVKNGKEDKVRSLLEGKDQGELGAILNARNTDNKKFLSGGRIKSETLLHIAAQKDSLEIVKLLLTYGVIYNDIDEQGNTPSSIAEYRSEVEKLLNTIDELFQAVKNGKEDEVRSLLQGKDQGELGAILNARNTDSKILIHVAIDSNEKDIGELLLEYCISKNIIPYILEQLI